MFALLAILADRQSRRALAAECRPLHAASPLTLLPPSWQAAVQDLIRATAVEGMPWGCSGGAVELALLPDGRGGELTFFETRGRVMARHVASPDDVVPTGKALLASVALPRPTAPLSSPTVPVSPVSSSVPLPLPHPKEAPEDARLQVQARVGPRVSGPDLTTWMAGELRGVVPFGNWAFGLWGRYQVPVAVPSDVANEISFTSFCAGLTVERHLFHVGPVRVGASVEPSVGAVMVSYGPDDQAQTTGAKIALWIGSSLAATFPLAGPLRGVVAVGGEVAPVGLSGAIPRGSDSSERSYPTYAAGLSAGLEVTLH